MTLDQLIGSVLIFLLGMVTERWLEWWQRRRSRQTEMEKRYRRVRG